MSPFKAFFLGFSLVMGFMTVASSAQADQACEQKCLTQNLASPVTKRKIAIGILTRSQMVTILTRKCVEECAQAAPEPEPTAVYQPPIIADSAPEAQPEVGGTDGGEANDTAGTTDKPAEVVPAPPEPETMPTIVSPTPTTEEKSAEIVAAVQTILDRKAEKRELEDLRLKVVALEKQLQGQVKVENTGDGTETDNEAEVPENTDPAETVGATDKSADVRPATKDLPASSEDDQPKMLIYLSIIVALAIVALLLTTLFKVRRKNRLEVARRAATADENELPPPPPPVRRGIVTGPPKISPDRVGTGTQVDFKYPSEVDP